MLIVLENTNFFLALSNSVNFHVLLKFNLLDNGNINCDKFVKNYEKITKNIT